MRRTTSGFTLGSSPKEMRIISCRGARQGMEQTLGEDGGAGLSVSVRHFLTDNADDIS